VFIWAAVPWWWRLQDPFAFLRPSAWRAAAAFQWARARRWSAAFRAGPRHAALAAWTTSRRAIRRFVGLAPERRRAGGAVEPGSANP
jgi:hypothetical protein